MTERKNRGEQCVGESETCLDMEIFFYFSRLMLSAHGIRIQGTLNLAHEAVKRMENPYARELLSHVIREAETEDGPGLGSQPREAMNHSENVITKPMEDKQGGSTDV